MIPLRASRVLDQYFLEARARLLDLAAILDRIDRGTDYDGVTTDMREEKLYHALQIIHDATNNRAEEIQKLFSLDYDPNWKKPEPRTI